MAKARKTFDEVTWGLGSMPHHKIFTRDPA